MNPIMNELIEDEPAVVELRRRVSEDLRAAMKARHSSGVAALRALLARLDNASAVPLTSRHAPVFGEPGDVPRKFLSWHDAEKLILDEIGQREHASDVYRDLNKSDEVARVQQELEIMRRYVPL